MPGRYIALAPARWDTVAVEPGDRLLPLDGDGWRLHLGDEHAVSGHFEAVGPIDDLVEESARQLGALLGADPDAADLTATAPLVPGVGDKIRAHPFTLQLEAELGHLLDIARSPEVRLRTETERHLLDRVKRPARRAPLALATRADDWEARTLTGVRPRRLLARVIDEELDFYENRAAARLIDHLLAWLHVRADALRALLALLERKDYSDGVSDHDYRRQHRLTALWGEEYALDAGSETARATAERVASLRRLLLATLDRALYRAVPRRAMVGGELRQTNLLLNDQRYRFVARLWRAWQRAGTRRSDPTERHAAQQALARAIDRFALLVVTRALGSLGVKIAADPAPHTWRLADSGAGLDGRLSFGDDGLSLSGAGWPALRFVPLPTAVDRDSAQALRAALTVDEPTDPTGDRAVALCVDDMTETHPADPSGPTAAFDPTIGRGPSLIAISPLCLESVERVRRALEWWLHAPRLARWPLTVTLPRALRPAVLDQTPWLAEAGGDAARLIDWPERYDREPLDAMAQSVPALRRDPDRRRAAVDEAHRALTDLVDRAEALGVCPSCHRASRCDRVGPRALQFTCATCHARWGSTTCARCHRETPFIDVEAAGRDHLGAACGWCPHSADRFR